MIRPKKLLLKLVTLVYQAQRLIKTALAFPSKGEVGHAGQRRG